MSYVEDLECQNEELKQKLGEAQTYVPNWKQEGDNWVYSNDYVVFGRIALYIDPGNNLNYHVYRFGICADPGALLPPNKSVPFSNLHMAKQYVETTVHGRVWTMGNS